MNRPSIDRVADLPSWVDQLQAAGRYVFTRAETEALGRAPEAIEAALRRLKRAGRIAALRRGLHVIVPLEYRVAGAPPASWFVDPLMRHLGAPYYVGLLTAAAMHGAAHQQPQEFQVVTAATVRPLDAGRVRVRCYRRRKIADVPVREQTTETGTMRVATPAGTAFDLVHFPHACGGFGNVATVLRELAERLDPAALAAAASLAPTADLQRLGFLLDSLGIGEASDAIRAQFRKRRRRPLRLRPDRPADDLRPDGVWSVIPNDEIEPDM